MQSSLELQQAMTATQVFLWTAPRCVSTAFERSIRELNDVKVLHEPLDAAFYRGPERISKELPLVETATFDSARSLMVKDYEGYEAVFCKSLCYQTRGQYENYIQDKFAKFKHTFLIRNPKKAIPSLYKACSESGYNCNDEELHGFSAMHELYSLVQQRRHPSPVVIDADDLLSDPEKIMRKYCIATGLPFKESMLTWTPRSFPEWEFDTTFRIWHGTVIESSGFIPRTVSSSRPSVDGLPAKIQAAVKEAIPHYEAMYGVRMC